MSKYIIQINSQNIITNEGIPKQAQVCSIYLGNGANRGVIQFQSWCTCRISSTKERFRALFQNLENGLNFPSLTVATVIFRSFQFEIPKATIDKLSKILLHDIIF